MLKWFVVLLELTVALLAASKNCNYPDTCEKEIWKPQCGTTVNPKTTSLSSVARKGDVFEICGELYRAKSDFNVGRIQCSTSPDDENQTVDETMWQKVELGTLSAPLTVDENRNRLKLRRGDIVYDEANRRHYRAAEDGKISHGAPLEPIGMNPDWMSQLRPLIGDQRLGDIIIPSTHDSGTWNCTEDSYLVDQNFLLQLAEKVTPQFLANWSRTQTETLGVQLEAGFRTLDLRVADMETVDGTFRWWHGITSSIVEEGLREIADFVQTYAEEILILQFGHFAAPGNIDDSTLPIPDDRKDVLSDIILSYLGPFMAPKSGLADNPTMNEVLATGASIIAIMSDDYIRAKDDRYWPSVIHQSWTGVTNSEDLFVERSSKLRNYLEQYSDTMTDISGCITPDEKTIIAALMSVYGNASGVAPGVTEVDPEQMSFEGLFIDLVSTARYGTNTDGMWARPADLYSSGASTHYHGTEEMLPHWIARPGLYKVNIIYTDDTESSRLVDIAISANRGEIGRQVSISFQGNSLDGYYVWNNYTADGGQAALNCSSSLARYRVVSEGFQINETWIELLAKSSVTFVEGFYPPDAEVQLQVSGRTATDWLDLYSGVIQQMIDFNEDVYLRGTDLEDGTGFAYTSYTYNLFGPTSHCSLLPDEGYLALVQW